MFGGLVSADHIDGIGDSREEDSDCVGNSENVS